MWDIYSSYDDLYNKFSILLHELGRSVSEWTALYARYRLHDSMALRGRSATGKRCAYPEVDNGF